MFQLLISFRRNLLQVFGIATEPVSAPMVNVVAVSNAAENDSVDHDMNAAIIPANLYAAVSAAPARSTRRALPFPTVAKAGPLTFDELNVRLDSRK